MPADFDIRRIEVIDDQTADMFRRMTPAQRVRVGFNARDFAKRVMAAGLQHQHPDWSKQQIELEVKARLMRDAG